MKLARPVLVGLVSVAAVVVAGSCCDFVFQPPLTIVDRLSIAGVAGDGQEAPVGTSVAVAPRVRLTNQLGRGVAGVTVVFAVTAGGGAVSGATQLTDTNGEAAVASWTLGTAPGVNTLTATAAAADVAVNPVTFTATARTGQPAVLTRQAGDGQTGTVGQTLPVRPAVRLTDRFGNPTAGVAVRFMVVSGGGRLSAENALTAADGVATAGEWTPGQTAGPNTLMATAAGDGITGNPATFSALALAGPPASITVHAGDGQQTLTDAPVPIPPAVRVVDAFGNPVAGVGVVFVPGQSGIVTGANQTTGPEGIATVGSWILGPDPGPYTLTATASGSGIQGNPVTFNAAALPRRTPSTEPHRPFP